MRYSSAREGIVLRFPDSPRRQPRLARVCVPMARWLLLGGPDLSPRCQQTRMKVQALGSGGHEFTDHRTNNRFLLLFHCADLAGLNIGAQFWGVGVHQQRFPDRQGDGTGPEIPANVPGEAVPKVPELSRLQMP